jgi:hypothetical protein
MIEDRRLANTVKLKPITVGSDKNTGGVRTIGTTRQWRTWQCNSLEKT